MLTTAWLAGSPAWALETQSRWSQVDVMRGVGIAAAVVGIVLLVLVQHVFRKKLRQGSYRRLLVLGLFVLPVIVTWTTTKTVMEGRSPCRRACLVMSCIRSSMTWKIQAAPHWPHGITGTTGSQKTNAIPVMSHTESRAP
jgi:hypothetical protein